jgi:hypothetical protein
MLKLMKHEQREQLFMTWGRMYSLIKQNRDKNERLAALADKLDHDLMLAKVEENYYTEEMLEKITKEQGGEV